MTAGGGEGAAEFQAGAGVARARRRPVKNTRRFGPTASAMQGQTKPG